MSYQILGVIRPLANADSLEINWILPENISLISGKTNQMYFHIAKNEPLETDIIVSIQGDKEATPKLLAQLKDHNTTQTIIGAITPNKKIKEPSLMQKIFSKSNSNSFQKIRVNH